MSAAAREVARLAAELRRIESHVETTADVVAQAIKSNIDRRQVAGKYRVDDEGTFPGDIMSPLAKYTLARRKQRGYVDDDPLKETGTMYRSIRARRQGAGRYAAGASGRKNRKKMEAQLGSNFTGILGSETGGLIPPRNPIGYSERDWQKIDRFWRKLFEDRKVVERVTFTATI